VTYRAIHVFRHPTVRRLVQRAIRLRRIVNSTCPVRRAVRGSANGNVARQSSAACCSAPLARLARSDIRPARTVEKLAGRGQPHPSPRWEGSRRRTSKARPKRRSTPTQTAELPGLLSVPELDVAVRSRGVREQHWIRRSRALGFAAIHKGCCPPCPNASVERMPPAMTVGRSFPFSSCSFLCFCASPDRLVLGQHQGR